ncbi:MAG: Asp-tRNA(Asn)/Glu-tRNA(Gln) amidotransferase A subunit family amidase [Gammaproteobacteria bacterium]|jgi:Asp-tRNA(Asn)/Glu-tRNA(Gln) amidotransferase A subunit family amidase
MTEDTNELHYLTASEALSQFRAKTLSPVDLLDAVITQAEAITETVNPLADRYFDDARKRAKQAEARYLKGNPRKLDGIPLIVKDSSAIKGIRATVGSLMFADRIASHTDPVVDRLLWAGANFFARATCPEFCWLFACHSRLWGVTRNPWRLDISPGGSSGGSAAAVAAGATTIATGSDSTGSIRQPAAQCGIVGYKSPYGRNPLDQHSSFDPYVNVGPMTRSVADAALMQNIMSGQHPLDHNSLRNRLTIPAEFADVRGLKIAYTLDQGHYEVIDDVRRETMITLDLLSQAGAEITEVNFDWASEAIGLAHMAEEFIFAGMLQDAIRDHGDKLSDYVPQLYETASSVTADDYRRGLTVAGQVWKDHLGPMFKQYDALITPGVSCPEVPAEGWQKDIIVVNGKEITDTDTAMTVLFNMFNRCPVLSVPSGMTDQGLPVGIQVVGRPYDDVMAFRIGQTIEDLRPWAHRRPGCGN